MAVISRETIRGAHWVFGMHMTITSLGKISLYHSQSRVRLSSAKFSIKLQMSFGAELIGFSLGTNDVVVTGERSTVAFNGQFIRVSQSRPQQILSGSTRRICAANVPTEDYSEHIVRDHELVNN